MAICETSSTDQNESVVGANELFRILGETFAITAGSPSAQLMIDQYVGRYGLHLVSDWEQHTQAVANRVAAKAAGMMHAHKHPTVDSFGHQILEADTPLDANLEMKNLADALRAGGALTGAEVGDIAAELIITDYQRLVYRQNFGSSEGYSSALCRVLDGELVSRTAVFRDGLFPALRDFIAQPATRLEATPRRLDNQSQTSLAFAYSVIRAAHTSRPPQVI